MNTLNRSKATQTLLQTEHTNGTTVYTHQRNSATKCNEPKEINGTERFNTAQSANYNTLNRSKVHTIFTANRTHGRNTINYIYTELTGGSKESYIYRTDWGQQGILYKENLTPNLGMVIQ